MVPSRFKLKRRGWQFRQRSGLAAELDHEVIGHLRGQSFFQEHLAAFGQDVLRAEDDFSVPNIALLIGAVCVRVGQCLSRIGQVARLAKEGLVITQLYGPMTLTETGARMATESQKRHEIVYQFLLTIGVSAATAAGDVEGIEHHVSAETLKCFRRYLEKAGL